MNDVNYFNELNCAITVCDKEGVIIYCNKKSKETFANYGDLIGKSLKDCHNAASWEKICNILKTGKSNSYTIEKDGQKKIIHQAPWYENGKIKGLIEFSIIIPFDMPHFIRE